MLDSFKILGGCPERFLDKGYVIPSSVNYLDCPTAQADVESGTLH